MTVPAILALTVVAFLTPVLNTLVPANLFLVTLPDIGICCSSPTPSALRCRKPVVQSLQELFHEPEWFVKPRIWQPIRCLE